MNETLVKDRENVDRTDVLLGSMGQVISSATQIIHKDQRRARLRNVLFDDAYKSQIIPKFKAIEIVRGVAADNKDARSFFAALKEKSDEIKGYDLKLDILINSQGTGKILSPLVARIQNVFAQYPKDRVFSHFRRYYDYYVSGLSSLNNKELTTKILEEIKRFLLLHEKRTNQVITVQSYVNNIRIWNPNSGHFRAYVEEAKQHIAALRNIDDKKVDSMLDSEAIQHILAYQGELNLLKDILRRISVGEEESTWKDFLKVYGSMRQIINAIDKKYFDKETANELMQCLRDEKHYGQQPEAWKAKFRDIIQRLEQKGNVIREAQNRLYELFEKIITRINEISDSEFNEAKKRIANIVGEIQKVSIMAKIELLRSVKRRERELNLKLKRLREGYANAESFCYTVANKFYSGLNGLKEINPDAFVDDLKDIEARKKPLYERGRRIMGSINPEDPNSFALLSNYMLPLLAYEDNLRARLDESKTKARDEFYGKLPQLLSELKKIMPNLEMQLDRLIKFLTALRIQDNELSRVSTN